MPTKALFAGAATAALLAAPVLAATTVAVDIPPVHSLVARVMQGVGEPALIVRPGASPHGYAMRPSEAALLQSADVVIWVGEELAPWLLRSIETLGADATSLELLDVAGTVTLAFREGATFDAHDHDDDHDHAAADDHDHAHDDHGHEAAHTHDHGADHDHDYEEVAEAADHDHDHEEVAEAEGHDHDHDGIDPHAWLDPVNGKRWLDAIAAALSVADPANASAYFQNAAAGKAELDSLIDEIGADLTPIAGAGFVVFHDAYHYFEARFGIEAAGAITLSDAAAPSPARVAEIKGRIEAMDAACVFSEPQFEPALVATVIEGTGARTGVLDPIGADLPLGPALYPTLLRNLRDSLVDCLGS